MINKSKEAELAEAPQKYYLYFLRGPKNHLYIGATSDLEKRIDRHKSGSGAEFAKRNNTYSIVYTEVYPNLLEARRRESQIKGWLFRQFYLSLRISVDFLAYRTYFNFE